MFRAVVEVIVDAHDDVERVPAFHRSGHDDFLHPALEEGRQLLRRAELSTTLQHDIHTEGRPIHVARFRVFGERDALIADADRILAVGRGLMRETTLHGVERQQMRRALRAAFGIVDDDPFKLGPVPRGAKSEATDATKTIDTNADFFHLEEKESARPAHGVAVWGADESTNCSPMFRTAHSFNCSSRNAMKMPMRLLICVATSAKCLIVLS